MNSTSIQEGVPKQGDERYSFSGFASTVKVRSRRFLSATRRGLPTTHRLAKATAEQTASQLVQIESWYSNLQIHLGNFL